MKEVNPRDTGVETLGGDQSTSSDFSINEQALDMAMDAFTQYSNPIQSIVREITSNGFDAHSKARQIRDQDVELRPPDISRPTTDYRTLNNFLNWRLAQDTLLQWAYLRDWEEEGVRVRMSPRYGDNRKIEIEDKGVGMAPMESPAEPSISIYTQFFASTKRDTNEALGFFGVGAKSPMGYTDMFEVVTRWCGTEYHYVVTMGADRPQIDLVDTNDTDEPNGTTVRINVDSTSDWRKFKKAARKQLAYFPNVLYGGSLESRVDNDFQIYEGEHLIYRTESPFNKLHLCIGGVYYPLDYEAVGLEEPSYGEKGWEVPIGLRFDIGDIEIVWNRESVKYTEDTVNKIKQKIEDMREELQEIYNTRYSDIEDIGEWLEAWKISQDNTLELNDDVSVELTDNFLEESVPDFTAYDLLESMPTSPFYLARAYKKIDGKGYVDQSHPKMNIKDFYYQDKDLYWVDDKYSPKTNRYIVWKESHGSFYLVRQAKSIYGSDLTNPDERIKAERRYISKFSNKKFSDFDFEHGKKNVRTDRLKQMIEFETSLLQEIRDQCTDYGPIETSDKFDEYDKNRTKKNPGSKNKTTVDKTKTFPAKRYDSSGNHSSSCWSRTRIEWEKIKSPDLIVYGHRADADKLADVGNTLTSFDDLGANDGYYSNKHKLNQDRAMVLKIAKTRAKYFEALDAGVHVDDYFDRYHGFLRRHYTREAVNKIVYTSDVPDMLKRQFPRVKTLTNKISTLSSPLSYIDSNLWLQRYDKADYIDPFYISLAEELKGWVYKYPLFQKMKGRRRGSMPEGTDFNEEIRSYINSKGDESPSLIYRFKSRTSTDDQ